MNKFDKVETKVIYQINGVPVEKGNRVINIQRLSRIFTKENINAKALRQSAWKRNK